MRLQGQRQRTLFFMTQQSSMSFILASVSQAPPGPTGVTQGTQADDAQEVELVSQRMPTELGGPQRLQKVINKPAVCCSTALRCSGSDCSSITFLQPTANMQAHPVPMADRSSGFGVLVPGLLTVWTFMTGWLCQCCGLSKHHLQDDSSYHSAWFFIVLRN